MGDIIYLNGQFVQSEDAKVSVFDHGLLYGDGVFEGIRAYDGNVFKLQEHIDRLYDSAKSIVLEIPLSKQEMVEAVLSTLRKNGYSSAYIRLVVTRGVGDLGLDPMMCPRANIIVIAQLLALFPRELYEKGIDVVCASTRRNPSDVLSPKVKSLNYLNNIFVKLEAHAAGVSEALVLNADGYVVEGSGENVFIVKGGILYTPPTYLGALEGITRATVLEIAAQQGYTVREQPFSRHDVYVADEVFLTGTAAEMMPVVKVDGRVVGSGKPGPYTLNLHREFQKRTTVEGISVRSTPIPLF
ncbi:branched-chain-amino-acid transaminase [Alicyclobacillaceae bacterium I2511]|nr:branched-chain-amino-acid transaminase [Alicyclobacillaceae bacterium I2511]